MKACIALDAMGGDHGPAVVVPAALGALEAHLELDLILVGDQSALNAELERHRNRYRKILGKNPSENPGKNLDKDSGERLKVHHASECVDMDELPSQALRGKKDSSMRVALDLVKCGDASACVSAGNTGALMAIARFVLKTIDGIDRPAIIAPIPSARGHVHVLDLGANVESSPEQLCQFAVMGAVLAEAVDNVRRPRVGLLNIGHEEIKGNERVKETSRMLSKTDLNYIGYVEGDGVYKGQAEVIVCDGFVGNVALKTTEGVAWMIGQFLKEEFNRTLLTRIAGMVAMPVLRALRARIDPRGYNGATLIGLKGIVVKSHGSADVVAFTHAIQVALAETSKNVPSRIGSLLGPMIAPAANHKEAV